MTARPSPIAAGRCGDVGKASPSVMEGGSVTREQRKIESYRAANEECARIIAADPVRYPGVMQEWARLVLQSLPERRAA